MSKDIIKIGIIANKDGLGEINSLIAVRSFAVLRLWYVPALLCWMRRSITS